ncbi:MAG TPA: hypothetical protein VEI97_01655 [bacterium]|nr:hypothetical protein [bacterium]
MLEDLYPEENDQRGDEAPAPPAEGPEPTDQEHKGPEWADEARLEEVFSSWTPGPPADAPDAEREMAHGLGSDLDLQAELSDDHFDAVVLESDRLEDVPRQGWSRSEDDVLVGAPRARLSFRRR